MFFKVKLENKELLSPEKKLKNVFHPRIIRSFFPYIMWLVFLVDITRTLIGLEQLSASRALFSRNARGPIMDYANYFFLL